MAQPTALSTQQRSTQQLSETAATQKRNVVVPPTLPTPGNGANLPATEFRLHHSPTTSHRTFVGCLTLLPHDASCCCCDSPQGSLEMQLQQTSTVAAIFAICSCFPMQTEHLYTFQKRSFRTSMSHKQAHVARPTVECRWPFHQTAGTTLQTGSRKHQLMSDPGNQGR